MDAALSFDDVGWLLDGLEHAAPAVRAASLEALVRLPLDRSVRLVLAERVDRGLRALAGGATLDDAPALFDAAPYVATPDVRAALAALAARGPGDLRAQAVFALVAAGDPAAVPGLAALLETGHEGRRAAAAEGLARLIAADAREVVGQARAALSAARNDADAQVRFWAAVGLARRGELEPMRAVLADVDAGEPFPPLFGDPQLFLARLAPIRTWPQQERQAIASLAADAQLSGEGLTLAELLRDAAITPAPQHVDFDPEALPRASAALDDMVGELRRVVGPLPTRPGEAEGPQTRDVIELMDYARHVPDPMAGLELGNRIVSLIAAIGPGFDTDADAGARVYMEWDRTGPALPQIAWVLSRAGAMPALAALGRHVHGDVDDEVRLRALRGALDVARALSAGPPILGGGDIADVAPDPGELADAPRARPRMRGTPPPTVGTPHPPVSRGPEPPPSAPEPPQPAPEPPRPAPAPPAAPPPPAAAGALDTVHLGASAPRTVVPGDEFTARFVAYVKALEAEVRRLLAELAPRDVSVLGVTSAQWRRGTEVTVRLSARRLEVDPPERTFTWDGTRALEDFQVFVPDDVRTGVTTTLRFEVAILGVRVATLTLPVEIAAERSAERTTADAEPAAAAFASYSSEDRARVHDCLNALTAATTMDVFMDVAGLRAGDDWRRRVAEEVGRRPVFLLFWSKAAKDSRWVDWEWREAFRQRGADGIQPVPLDPPALAAPPPELDAAHFNSVHALLRVADQALRPPPSAGPPAGA